MINDVNQHSSIGMLDCEFPVFACFVTRWCHSCYPTCLLADGLIKDYAGRVKFAKIVVEENPAIAERYNITAVPTILLFQDCQLVKKLVGFQERSSLRALLNSATAENEQQRGKPRQSNSATNG